MASRLKLFTAASSAFCPFLPVSIPAVCLGLPLTCLHFLYSLTFLTFLLSCTALLTTCSLLPASPQTTSCLAHLHLCVSSSVVWGTCRVCTYIQQALAVDLQEGQPRRSTWHLCSGTTHPSTRTILTLRPRPHNPGCFYTVTLHQQDKVFEYRESIFSLPKIFS